MEIEEQTEDVELDVEEVEEEQDDSPKSTRDVIKQAIADQRAAQDDSEEADLSSKTSEHQSDNGVRNRDARGRFTKKSQTESEGQEPQSGEAEEQTAPISPPVSWPADAKKWFVQLPREQQEFVARREQELAQFGHQARQKYAGLEKVLEPYRDTWARNGIDPEKKINQLLSWDSHIERGREAAIVELAQSRGISPQQLASYMLRQQGAQPQAMQGGAHQPQEFRDPRMDILLQQMQQQKEGEAGSEAEAWLNELDDNGQPLRPYVTELSGELESLVSYLRSQNPTAPHRQILDRAYSMALAGRPDLQEHLEAERKAAEEAKRIAEQRERVDRARKAGAAVSGAANGNVARPVPTDRRELIRAVVNGEL